MNEKQFKLKLSEIALDNCEVGVFGKGVESFSKKCGVTKITVYKAFEGDLHKIETIFKILESCGYEIKIVRKENTHGE